MSKPTREVIDSKQTAETTKPEMKPEVKPEVKPVARYLHGICMVA